MSKKKNSNKNKDNKINNQNLHTSISIIIAFFCICLILIKGENVWTFIRNFYLGIFGINSIFLPFFIITIIFLKSKNGSVNKFKSTLSFLASIFFSASFGIFYFPDEEFILYFYEEGMKNAGVLSGFLDFILIKLFGISAATAILFLILFLILAILFKIDFAFMFEKIQEFLDIFKNKFKNINLSVKKNKKEEFFDNNGEVKEVVNSKSLGELKESIESDENNLDVSSKQENKSENKLEFKDEKSDVEKVTAAFIEKEKNKTEEKISVPNSFSPLEPSDYKFPLIDLLNEPKKVHQSDITNELNTNGKLLIDTLMSFNVKARIVDICRGPAITRYEIQPASGVKVSKITTLADDIALNLAALGVRIEAPIPGKSAVGVEIANKVVSMVTVREIIESGEFINSKSKLTVALGKDISGKCVVTDLGRMPHLLIAGSTGAGKSVCVNSFIVSLLYKSSPDDVKLLMIDPKVVELGVYNGIPHLLVPVVTDPRKSAGALNWAVNEMLGRYKIFAEVGVRDISSYNSFVEKNKEAVDKNGEPRNKMARIVIIIDELSDLMMAAPNEIEDYVCRLTQMARAAGMHLVIATQRPSVDVITGVIKANVPSRIALAVSSQIDSRTILDMGGAEKLLGRGDMLFSPLGAIKPMRVQGCYVDEQEIERVVNYVKDGLENEYDESIISGIERGAEQGLDALQIANNNSDSDKDPMLEDAIKCVVELGQASTSLLQRKLRVGYARAGRLVDEMEKMGIVGPHEGSKPRAVLLSYQASLERLNQIN
ncbi:MAG: DNA translocase FtsK [Clostridia bacterium]|nr:DNA translocase FtsK [Clostridia bacterium]